MNQPLPSPAFDAESERYHVPNLGRALMMLEHLAARQRALGVSEIADEMDIPKNSAFRILTTLHAYGYLTRDDQTKQYAIGPKLLSLGYAGYRTGHLVEQSMDSLRWVRDQTEESAFVGVIDSAEGVILEQVLSHQQVKVVLAVGSRFPLHTAAPAKACLALLANEQRDAILDEMTFERFTDQTITTRRDFLAELDRVRELGYAFDLGEHNDGIRCVGAAVRDHRGGPVGGIWITAPAFRMDQKTMQRLGPVLREGARRISERMGYQATT